MEKILTFITVLTHVTFCVAFGSNSLDYFRRGQLRFILVTRMVGLSNVSFFKVLFCISDSHIVFKSLICKRTGLSLQTSLLRLLVSFVEVELLVRLSSYLRHTVARPSGLRRHYAPDPSLSPFFLAAPRWTTRELSSLIPLHFSRHQW